MAELSVEEINELAGMDPAVSGVKKLAAKTEAEAKQQTPKKPAPKANGVPKSALGKTGFLLRQFGDASKGRETPLQALQRSNIRQEELAIRQTNIALQAVEAGRKEIDLLFKNGTPTDEQIEQTINRFKRFDKLGPGTTESLRFLAEQRKTGNAEDLKQFESVLESNGVNLATLGMPLSDVKKLWDTSPEFKQALINKADARHLSTGMTKFREAQNLKDQRKISGDTKIELPTFIENVNPLLPPEFRLTENERAALERNSGNIDLELGLGTRDESTTLGKLQADRTDLEQQLSLAEGEEAEKLKRGLKEIQARIDKEIAVVGRTQFDADQLTGSTRQKAIKEFNNKVIASRKFVKLSNKVIESVSEGAAKLGVTGAIARLGDEVKSVARNIGSEFGLDISGVSKNIEDYEFGTLANESAELKTNALTLALIFASASGIGEGRALTDRDIQIALDTVGASTNSPGQLISRLRAIQTNLDDGLAIEADVSKFDFDGIPELSPPDVTGSDVPEQATKLGVTQLEWDNMTSEEREKF